MDLVQEIKAVRFTMAHKGYDCAAVDSYLAKLRDDLTTVQEERESNATRISELEQRLANGEGGSETEGTLRRTLLLAQRLADETEAEATAAATDLVETATSDAAAMRDAATTESEQMRSEASAAAEKLVRDAEAEAAASRSHMESELAASQREKEALEAGAQADAERVRAEARAQVEAILTTAEVAGAERVEALELTAQTQAAEMREPIRAEVSELEGVRGRLLADIASLEVHLESQRDRVKNAVEALRVGMSGSIEDLERIAEDEELLGVEPAPEHSGASFADVEAAPDIEIRDRVRDGAPDQPSVDSIEEEALASMPPPPITEESFGDHESMGDHGDLGEHGAVEEMAADEVVVDDEVIVEQAADDDGIFDQASDLSHEEAVIEEAVIEEAVIEEAVIEEAVIEEPVVEDAIVEEAVVEDAVVEEVVAEEAVIDDAVEWATPTVTSNVVSEPDVDAAEGSGAMAAGAAAAGIGGGFLAADALSDDGIDLADSGPITEPIPVFGSDVDQEPIELDQEPTDLFGTEMDGAERAEEMEVEGSAPVGSFVKRFAESLDTTPVSGQQ